MQVENIWLHPLIARILLAIGWNVVFLFQVIFLTLGESEIEIYGCKLSDVNYDFKLYIKRRLVLKSRMCSVLILSFRKHLSSTIYEFMCDFVFLVSKCGLYACMQLLSKSSPELFLVSNGVLGFDELVKLSSISWKVGERKSYSLIQEISNS